MEQRIGRTENLEGALKAMLGLSGFAARSKIEKNLRQLVDFRVSQINGCAYCLDMHSKDLRAAGEDERRLYLISAWRDAPFFTEREKAAFAWAEAVTLLDGGQVADEVFREARKHFSEQELIDLTMCVVAINGWNRLNIAFRTPAGTYQPGQFAAAS